jgi:hypothetical protein
VGGFGAKPLTDFGAWRPGSRDPSLSASPLFLNYECYWIERWDCSRLPYNGREDYSSEPPSSTDKP